MKKTKVVIVGASGFGKEVHDILSLDKKYEVIGFIDSDKSLKGKLINKVPVLGDDSVLEDVRKKGAEGAVVAIARYKIREKLFSKCKDIGFNMIKAIHPNAYISKTAEIGEGTMIYAGVTIQPNAKVGKCVLLNANASIGHDTVIGDFANINPTVSIGGLVKLGDYAYIGIGASVIEKISIGKEALIGAGAVVIRDIPDRVVAIGVPAKPIKERE